MTRLRNFFTNKWVLGIIGLTALSLLLWFGADFIKFGENNSTLSHSTRLIIIGFIVTLWLVWNISQLLVERRQNQQLIGDLESDSADTANPDEERSQEDLAAISGRFQDAMSVLKKSRFKTANGGTRSLYQLPWYIIIGPPGSGKTTALVNSGLEFPLANSHGKEGLGGIGGTRNCDWWFTNEAVLIDTAGRYTTQDSHRVIDNKSWQGFMGLLKKYRRRRPINGALIAISLQDLMVQTAEQRLHQAKTIRTRINELQDQLGIRFPIYLTFTKCDLVAGFSEFFDNMSQAEREQVWGVSFPAESDANTGAPIDTFASEFKQLIERLNQRLLWRVNQERNIEKRSVLQGFPARMESLGDIVDDFVKQTFGANRYNTVPMVRGVYFSSATQEGSPIDRMMAAVTSDFGLERDMGRQQSGNGKSFFIGRLLSDVIFPESELVGTNRKLEKGMLWLRRGCFAVLAGVFGGAILLWTGSVTQNKIYMGEVSEDIAQFKAARDTLSKRNNTLVDTLPALNPLRASTQVYDQEEHPLLNNLGLYDGSVDKAADQLYREQLNVTYLPALLHDIERQLSRTNGDDKALLETLKVYLMLFNPDKRDLNAVRSFMQSNWQAELSGQANKQQQLSDHLNALFAQPLPSDMKPNTRVVERARQQLRRIPVPQRLYAQLKNSDLASHSIDLYGDIGGDTEQVFGLKDSNPLFATSYIYTKAGYKQMDFGADSPMLTQMSEDRWIYGQDIEGEDFSEADRAKIGRDVERLYLGEYSQNWQKFLDGIKIARFKSTANALDTLGILADPVYSPLLSVAEVAANNTALTPKPELPGGLNANGVALPVSSNARRAGSALAGSAASALNDRYQPTPVDIRFEELQRITKSEKGRPARIQQYLSAIQGVQEYLTVIDSAPNSNMAAFESAKARFAGGSGDAIKQLRIKAANAPAPMNNWLNDIADSTWALVMAKAKRHVDTVWREDVYNSYRSTLAGRYPMVAGRDAETPAMEFNSYFQADGIEQKFVKTYIKPFVDTRRWKPKQLEGQSLPIAKSSLAQMRRAENIRRAFFSNGADASVKFRIEPTKLDSSVRLFSLELGESRVLYSHGPRTAKSLQWTAGEDNRVRVIFEDLNETVHRKHFESDWAWLRLLDLSQLDSTNNKSVHLITFEEAGREAQFKLTANSSINPFDHSLLRNYRVSEAL